MKSMKAKIFFTVFFIYLFYVAPGYITSGTLRYIDLTKSIVENKVFNIDGYYKNTRDQAFFNGHYYIGAAPGMSLAAVPIYAIIRPLLTSLPAAFYKGLELYILNIFFTFFLSLLPGVIMAVLLYDLLKNFDLRENERILTVFGFSLGTIIFYYSTRLMAHVFGAFTLFAAFYIFFKLKHAKEGAGIFLYLLAGVFLTASVLIDYILLIGAVLIFSYALLNFKKEKTLGYLMLMLGMAMPACVYAYYHQACFNNPFAMAGTYSQMIGPGSIKLPNSRTAFELAFGLYRGLFVYMPVILLSAYGIFTFFRNPDKRFFKEVIIICLFSISMFLVIAGYANWDGGGDFGPRYFIPILPFLMIPIAFVFKKLKWELIFWITAVSVFINWCGVQYGDADNVFTDILLFLFMGLNSGISTWLYNVTSEYIHPFNVVTHFSPFVGFVLLAFIIYLIWKDNEWKAARR